MNTRLAILAVAGILMAGPAFATTDSNRPTQTAEECTQLIDVTKKVTEGNDVGEKAQNEIDKLLTALQDQCNAQQFEQADQTAALIRGLVATE